MWRQVIVDAVREHPGIGFTDLKELIGAENGVIQHHLRQSPQIERAKGGVIPAGYCDDCALQDHCRDTCIRKLLHDDTKREILERLDAGQQQTDIAAHLDLHRSTVSYHVQQLSAAGAISGGEPVPAVQRLLPDD